MNVEMVVPLPSRLVKEYVEGVTQDISNAVPGRVTELMSQAIYEGDKLAEELQLTRRMLACVVKDRGIYPHAIAYKVVQAHPFPITLDIQAVGSYIMIRRGP